MIPTGTHDADGDVTAITNHATGGAMQSFNHYTYDAHGQPIAMTTAVGTYSYGYDADGQFISVQARGGRSITYYRCQCAVAVSSLMGRIRASW